MVALDEALLIRYEKLGPTHIDTVETLNKIARVQMKLCWFVDSRNSYYEVLKLRQAIFGDTHPCVAITAHALATVHARLYEIGEAKLCFSRALTIFQRNGMGKHKFADRIRQDISELQHVNTRIEV